MTTPPAIQRLQESPPTAKKPPARFKTAWFHAGLDAFSFYLVRHDTPPEEVALATANTRRMKLKWLLAILDERGQYHVPEDPRAETELRKEAAAGHLEWRDTLVHE